MNMPGFDAEASLNQVKEMYRMAGVFACEAQAVHATQLDDIHTEVGNCSEPFCGPCIEGRCFIVFGRKVCTPSVKHCACVSHNGVVRRFPLPCDS